MRIEFFSDCLQTTAAYIVGENHPNRFCCFLNYNDFLCVFIFEESEGRDGYDSFLLLLPVTCSDPATAISGIEIVDQPFESDDQVIVLVEGIDVFGCRDDTNIVFAQVIDEQGGLCPMTPQPRQVSLCQLITKFFTDARGG